MINPFFKKHTSYKVDDLLNLSDIENLQNFKNDEINDIKDLVTATKKDITFFHSKKYENLASKTNAMYCVRSTHTQQCCVVSRKLHSKLDVLGETRTHKPQCCAASQKKTHPNAL